MKKKLRISSIFFGIILLLFKVYHEWNQWEELMIWDIFVTLICIIISSYIWYKLMSITYFSFKGKHPKA